MTKAEAYIVKKRIRKLKRKIFRLKTTILVLILTVIMGYKGEWLN